MSTTTIPRQATQPNPSTPKPCDAFAEAAWRDVFRDRDLRLAREPGFVDRPPQKPRRLGEITTKIVAEAGERAVQHWLDAATRAENQQKRAAALEIAENIAKALGLTLADFIFGRAA
jgi:hypothetical protein